MKKLGKVCWWIAKVYFKLNISLFAFLGYGELVYRFARRNVRDAETFRDAWDIACDQVIVLLQRALIGFKYLYFCAKYKLKQFLS